MAKRRRDKFGRFSKKRGKGMGSIISIRKKSLGALGDGVAAPAVLGGGAAALTILAIRYFVNPMQGTTQQALVRWASLFGLATGTLASLALYMMGGRQGGKNAMQGLLGAGVVSGFAFGSDYVLKEKGGSLIAAVTASAPAAALPAETAMAGFGAIVPEYSRPGMGAIVMEPSVGGKRPGSIGSYGESVSLQGVNTGAFGTPGFQA